MVNHLLIYFIIVINPTNLWLMDNIVRQNKVLAKKNSADSFLFSAKQKSGLIRSTQTKLVHFQAVTQTLLYAFFIRFNTVTLSTCLVIGNISTGVH